MFQVLIQLVQTKAPMLQTLPSLNEGLAGEKIKVSCVVSSGSLPIDFIWFKDNQTITSKAGILIQSVAEDQSNLVISKAESIHSGIYKCLAKNEDGHDSSQVDLRVKGNFLN